MLVNQGPGIYLMKNGAIDEFCIAADGTLSSIIFNLRLEDESDLPVQKNGTQLPSFTLVAKMLDGFSIISDFRYTRKNIDKETMEEVYLLHDGWCLYRDKVYRDKFYLFGPTGDFCYFVRQKEKGAKMVAPFCTEAPCYTNKQGENSSTPLTKTLSFLKTVAGFSTRTTAKLTNYFLVEPAWNVVQRALWSVRYVVMASVVGMSTYGFFNPSAALGLLKSMIPSVSIKVEAPEILK